MLDYVVVKCPRFAFEKFPTADPTLTTQMKSVGESMAIGRTFKEAFQKGLRALEIGPDRLGGRRAPSDDRLADESLETLRGALRQPTPERIFQIKRALLLGASVDEIARAAAASIRGSCSRSPSWSRPRRSGLPQQAERATTRARCGA